MAGRFVIVVIGAIFWPLAGTAQALDTGAHTLVEAAPGIYAVEPKFAGANAALIINESGVIIIDSHSSPASSATLIDAVKSITDKPIRYVINTHWHVDHHSGNEAFLQGGTNVDIIAHDHTREDIPTLGRGQFQQTAPYRTMPLDGAAAALQSGADTNGHPLTDAQRHSIEKFHGVQEDFIATGDAFTFTLPNITIDKSITLHGAPYTVQVMYLYPAHTRGDVVVYVPDQKILIVGDILTKPILWTWSSYPQAYIKTLTALEALEIDKILIGHGGPILVGKDYLTTVRRTMETIVAFSIVAKEDGLSVEEAVAKASSDAEIQANRRRFVADNDQENQMFDQMIGWTIDRAYMEIGAN
jgi:glyoxylase-like metal-dependent hydrolase (beta-lactamase superfamily II)